jgi:hypothetical protein
MIEFLVTSRHERRIVRAGSATWVPYAAWHARRDGSWLTACGLPCVGWRTFWSLRLSQAGGNACPECRAVLQHADALIENVST